MPNYWDVLAICNNLLEQLHPWSLLGGQASRKGLRAGGRRSSVEGPEWGWEPELQARGKLTGLLPEWGGVRLTQGLVRSFFLIVFVSGCVRPFLKKAWHLAKAYFSNWHLIYICIIFTFSMIDVGLQEEKKNHFLFSSLLSWQKN